MQMDKCNLLIESRWCFSYSGVDLEEAMQPESEHSKKKVKGFSSVGFMDALFKGLEKLSDEKTLETVESYSFRYKKQHRIDFFADGNFCLIKIVCSFSTRSINWSTKAWNGKHNFKKKFWSVAKVLYFYFSDAMHYTNYFTTRQLRPSAWNGLLEIGDTLKVPVVFYARVSWLEISFRSFFRSKLKEVCFWAFECSSLYINFFAAHRWRRRNRSRRGRRRTRPIRRPPSRTPRNSTSSMDCSGMKSRRRRSWKVFQYEFKKYKWRQNVLGWFWHCGVSDLSMHRGFDCLIDWLGDWVSDWLIDWLIDFVILVICYLVLMITYFSLSLRYNPGAIYGGR